MGQGCHHKKQNCWCQAISMERLEGTKQIPWRSVTMGDIGGVGVTKSSGNPGEHAFHTKNCINYQNLNLNNR